MEEYQKDNSFVEFLDTYCSDTDFVIGYPDEVGGGFSFKDEASLAAEPLVGELLDDDGNVVYRDDQASDCYGNKRSYFAFSTIMRSCLFLTFQKNLKGVKKKT